MAIELLNIIFTEQWEIQGSLTTLSKTCARRWEIWSSLTTLSKTCASFRVNHTNLQPQPINPWRQIRKRKTRNLGIFRPHLTEVTLEKRRTMRGRQNDAVIFSDKKVPGCIFVKALILQSDANAVRLTGREFKIYFNFDFNLLTGRLLKRYIDYSQTRPNLENLIFKTF